MEDSCEVGRIVVSVVYNDHTVIAHTVDIFVSSRRRHSMFDCDWSSDVFSSDLQASVHSPGSTPKSTREVVLPICSSGPGTTVPVEVTNRKAPSRCCAMPKAVTGPCLTSNSRSEERRVGKECRSRGGPYH